MWYNNKKIKTTLIITAQQFKNIGSRCKQSKFICSILNYIVT